MPRLVQLLVPCALLCGCFGPGEGLEVPKHQIYFPTGLALDRDANYLYVVSSDFDLQYNGGAIQSYHLPSLEENLLDEESAEPCGELGERDPADKLLYPGRCKPIRVDVPGLQKDRVKIGAFATDAIMRPLAASDADRLLVPVRGDTTLHWLNVQNGVMECDQDDEGACSERHRAGNDPGAENTRDLRLDAEPFGIAANAEGSTIVLTNQTTGTASLFVADPENADVAPALRFALSSDRIPSRPMGIVNLPRTPKEIRDAENANDGAAPDAFLMTFRNSAQVRLVRFADDGASSPEREYLVDGGGVGIDANSVGTDSRGIAVDPSERERAIERCNGDVACEDLAALTPIDVYVANRAPASLLIGRTRPPLEYPYFFQSLPLTVGPSQVVVGKVKAPSGEEETRVFVACFDSRRVFVYDPQRERFEAEIQTGRGPHAMAVDTARSLLYVGHFTDSYVGIFSLDLGKPATYGTMLGTLGNPRSPRSSK
jgi:DNA-binding beta-propeller fold protein YncE